MGLHHTNNLIIFSMASPEKAYCVHACAFLGCSPPRSHSSKSQSALPLPSGTGSSARHLEAEELVLLAFAGLHPHLQSFRFHSQGHLPATFCKLEILALLNGAETQSSAQQGKIYLFRAR